VSSANWKQENHEDWSVVSNMEYVDYVFVVVVGEGRLLLDDNLKVRDELSHMFRPPPARLHVPNGISILKSATTRCLTLSPTQFF